MVRTDYYPDYEGMGEYATVQEFDIYGGVYIGSPDCAWRRGGGWDDALSHDYPGRWAYSFFGGATEGIRFGDGPEGTYVYSTEYSSHTAVITFCEESAP